jgi:hypothetical protein
MIDLDAGERIDSLRDRLDDIEANRGEIVYSTNRYKFTSQHDVREYIKDNKIESCGIYWDLFSCLVRMGSKRQTPTQQAQATFAATRLETSTLELELSSSMSFERPPVLFVLDSTQVDVQKCGNYESWSGIGHNVSYLGTMTADITKFINGIRGTLRFRTGDTALAEALLDSVETQFNKLTSFMEKFYKELTTVANFPKESAWRLIGRCVGGFFQSMIRVRSEVTMLEEWRTLDSKAQMIWTVLRCHAVVDQFIALDFRGHTTMVQQMTLFMMTERVDPAQLTKVMTLVEAGNKAALDASKQVKTLTDSLEKVKSEAAAQKRKYDDLRSEVEALKRKVAPRGAA